MALLWSPAPTLAALIDRNGPLLLGVDIACLLYGCLIVQLCVYLGRYSRRKERLKYTVIAATVISGLGIVFAIASQYAVLVSNAGNAKVWLSLPWQTVLIPISTGLSALLVHLFFAYRIARFQSDLVGRTLAILIILVAALAFAGALYLIKGSNTLQLSEVVTPTVSRIWTCASSACDVLIAVTMIALLFKSREQTHFRKTQHMLKRLIIQSIETGSITAVVMVLMSVLYETMKSRSQTYYLICELALGPLYANVMLYVLNAREEMARAADTVQCNTSDIGFPTSHVPTSAPS